mmetsp:Transcript_9390/g.26807  ORF Transcript_9390/g.26807 Transcript_9390/m.26807 type:complete len:107 (-) Transcript_9390:767-1087(-)
MLEATGINRAGHLHLILHHTYCHILKQLLYSLLKTNIHNTTPKLRADETRDHRGEGSLAIGPPTLEILLAEAVVEAMLLKAGTARGEAPPSLFLEHLAGRTPIGTP